MEVQSEDGVLRDKDDPSRGGPETRSQGEDAMNARHIRVWAWRHWKMSWADFSGGRGPGIMDLEKM